MPRRTYAAMALRARLRQTASKALRCAGPRGSRRRSSRVPSGYRARHGLRPGVGPGPGMAARVSRRVLPGARSAPALRAIDQPRDPTASIPPRDSLLSCGGAGRERLFERRPGGVARAGEAAAELRGAVCALRVELGDELVGSAQRGPKGGRRHARRMMIAGLVGDCQNRELLVRALELQLERSSEVRRQWGSGLGQRASARRGTRQPRLRRSCRLGAEPTSLALLHEVSDGAFTDRTRNW
jgi:hypothetical protein